ncbi:MAG: hypothetical protein MZU91_05780 [Desulfosudis oleivorans]|nr:hypothetical protein [Desulfosudis oleivorans]
MFNSIINTVNHDYKNKKIYLYGSGAFLDLLVKHTQLSSLPICGIFDYDLTKEGKEVNGWRIYNSQNMKDFDIDLLLVTLYNPDKVKSFIDSNCDADKIYMI